MRTGLGKPGVLVTAPQGPSASPGWGSGSWKRRKLSTYRFLTLRESLRLPRVGQRVRHRRQGTVWKVIEEKEVWAEGVGEEAPPWVPALYLRFWKVSAAQPGRGQTRSHRYIPGDHSFADHGEALEE